MMLRTSVLASLAALAVAACAVTPISRRTGTFAPKTPGYTYQQGVVSHQGSPILRVVQTDVDTLSTNYEIRREGGGTEASVLLSSSYDHTLLCRAEFPALGVHYEVRIPIVPFTDLLAAYIDNRVLVDGHVDAEGLRAYASGHGFQLVDTAAQINRLDAASDRVTCNECSQSYRKCQVDEAARRQHPAAGVNIARSCEKEYQTCSQHGILQDRTSWPCGAPPN